MGRMESIAQVYFSNCQDRRDDDFETVRNGHPASAWFRNIMHQRAGPLIRRKSYFLVASYMFEAVKGRVRLNSSDHTHGYVRGREWWVLVIDKAGSTWQSAS